MTPVPGELFGLCAQGIGNICGASWTERTMSSCKLMVETGILILTDKSLSGQLRLAGAAQGEACPGRDHRKVTAGHSLSEVCFANAASIKTYWLCA